MATDQHPVTQLSAVQTLRRTQHALSAAVVLVGAIRGLRGPNPIPTVSMAAGLVGWYVVGLYLERHRRTPAMATLWLAVLTVLCIAAVVVSVDFAWVSFAIFVLYASVLPPKPAYGAIGGLALTIGVVLVIRWPGDGHWTAQFIGPILGAAAAAALVSVYKIAANESRERQDLIDELLRAQDDLARANLDAGIRSERERVAVEVHDTLAQGFASTVFLGRKAFRALENDDREAVESALRGLVDVGSAGLEDARRLVRGLAPRELDETGLAQALQVLVDRAAERHGFETSRGAHPRAFVRTGTPMDGLPDTSGGASGAAKRRIDLRVDGTPRLLSDRVEAALLRVAQEALSNAVEHGRADRIVMTLTYGMDEVSLDVVDDGRGFDIKDRRHPGWAQSRGFGLGGMARRIENVGGTYSIESAPGSGTAIAASIGAAGPEEAR